MRCMVVFLVDRVQAEKDHQKLMSRLNRAKRSLGDVSSKCVFEFLTCFPYIEFPMSSKLWFTAPSPRNLLVYQENQYCV